MQLKQKTRGMLIHYVTTCPKRVLEYSSKIFIENHTVIDITLTVSSTSDCVENTSKQDLM